MHAPGQKDVYLRATVVDRSWRDERWNLQDMIFQTVRRALDASDVSFADIDTVVAASHDLVDGRSLSSMVSSPAAGSYLNHEIRFSDDGAAALAMACTRVSCGDSTNCIVAGWARISEGQPDKIANALFDPFFAKPLGLTEVSVSALRASAALRRFDGYRAHRHAAAAMRLAAAEHQLGPSAPLALPLHPDELPRWADLAVATVLTSEPTDVRVAGVGMSAEPYWLGDRDLLDMPALRQAATVALGASGRTVEELSVVELDGLTLFDEALAAEAIGLAGPGGGMELLAAPDSAINRSGGYAAGYGAPAMGLVRVADAAAALRSAGPNGAAPPVGLATGASVVAAQTQTAIVLELA